MSSTSSHSRNSAGSLFGQYNGTLLFLFNFALAIPVFWFGLVSLKEAWSVPEYSHGPLIPIVSAYLFLREMKFVPPTERPVTDRWPGFWVMMVALAISTIGNVTRIPDIVTYGMIVWLWGLVLLSFGAHRGIVLWTGVLHLIYMLPLPNFIYWHLSTQLQFVSSEIGVAIVRSFSIPVFLDGNVIDLGIYKLQVAEACSGLRYLFPVLSFSYIFAILYQGPRWHKVVLLVTAAPLTVLMNSFRIGVIGVLVNAYGIEQAEGFLHAFEGWVIFGACVGILFIMAILMQRLSPNPMPLADTIDLDFSKLQVEIARIRDHVPSRAMVALAVVMALLTAAMYGMPKREYVEVLREDFSFYPLSYDGWEGRRQYLDPVIEDVLGADDYLSTNFVHPDEPVPVDLFVAYYNKLTEGSGVHSPEVCIPAGGWEMSRIQERKIELTVDGVAMDLVVNRAIIQKGLSRQLVYYWFDQRGRKLTSDYEAKLYALWDAAFRGRTDGSLVRVLTPIRQNESEATADGRLEHFLENTVKILPEYIPE